MVECPWMERGGRERLMEGISQGASRNMKA